MSRPLWIIIMIVLIGCGPLYAQATGSRECAQPKLAAGAQAGLIGQIETAIVERAKKRHSFNFSNAAFALGASVPARDLAEKRAAMKEIYDRLSALSKDQQKAISPDINAYLNNAGPTSSVDAEFLHAIQFSGNSLGWALDWNGMIERTSDGGLTWVSTRVVSQPKLLQRLQPNAGVFRSMHFADAKFGMIVGVHPVYWTEDGGLSWHELRPPSLLNQLNAVYCNPNHSCWVGGSEPSAIYQRDTGQSSWTPEKTPAKGAITAIQFVGSTGWAVSTNGEIIGTTDGGKHWSELFHDQSKGFRALHFVDEQHGWTVGNNAVIMSTQDGGKTWIDHTIRTPAGFPVDELRFNAVKFIDTKRGWTAGLHGIIFGTSDGGECWSVQRWEGPVHSLTINALEITDGPTVWAAGNVGNIFVSTDGGAFWFPVHGISVGLFQELKRAMDKLPKQ